MTDSATEVRRLRTLLELEKVKNNLIKTERDHWRQAYKDSLGEGVDDVDLEVGTSVSTTSTALIDNTLILF